MRLNIYPLPPQRKIPEFEDKEVRTVQQDPRFQNTNMTNWCYTSFVDYKRCQRLLGESHECCPQFKKIYKAICPNAWVERWEEQIKDGTFAATLPEKKK
ncbi:uncharacterized protein LOC126734517 [Anthonomus grandis grandis]|uniref:uncharacterized protein LOC126734517 n=1 Tax=Anthonomus grandis grandis TaxID=2921223 RepID=UPI0021668408|nr:uncharacterized protein LOC126734517 [Anthonomus grandis grandis]